MFGEKEEAENVEVSELVPRIVTLETENTELRSKNEELYRKLNKAKKNIKRLKAENKDLQQRIVNEA